ncbi:MAG: aminopeptidase, partial [Planctomycetaceae bacterium]|nr:aminopeptidase [Planctomycetaceae bacterium]
MKHLCGLRRTYGSLMTAVALCLVFAPSVCAQPFPNNKYKQQDKFRQLDELFPTPNDYRTASGAPGHRYWQQAVDYSIDVTLDDQKQRIIGSEEITYTNHSPDRLSYLWLQLDSNRFHPKSADNLTSSGPSIGSSLSFDELNSFVTAQQFPGATKIKTVRNLANNQVIPHTVVGSNMRVDLPQPLASGEVFRFRVDWEFSIPNVRVIRARGGYEFFEKDGNYIYEIAQWFPRLCVYTDITGWQHKEHLGRGEFALEFGDYVVRITAPADHIVAATGELQNPDDVLTEAQRERLAAAATAETPVFIVTPEEAKENQKEGTEASRTWIFHASNVRDFAFASSRKFIWDAQGHNVGGNQVMAMSYYPNEAEPLWSRYSTHAIIHTLNVYSRYTFDYPYPVAISVNGPVYGMEYPMICFNGPRPEKDGTYSERVKYGLISVVIHEVG